MAEISDTGLKQMRKMSESAIKAFKNELKNDPDVAECLGTVIETAYAVTDCKLWDEPFFLYSEVSPDEKTVPYGTHITFIPNPGNEKLPPDRFEGLFTLTRGAKDARISALLKVEGRIDPNSSSHVVERASFRSSELTYAQAIGSVVQFGMGMASKLP